MMKKIDADGVMVRCLIGPISPFYHVFVQYKFYCIDTVNIVLLRARRAKLIIAYAEKKSHVTLSVCVYVPLYNLDVSRQISDFLVLKIKKKICGATRTKIISFT